MIKNMESFGIWLAAVFFFGMGVLALVWPVQFTGPLGLTLAPAHGTNEVRAVYGGFGVAMGALILYAAGLPEIRSGVYLTLALALYAMASGRIVSVVVERRAHPSMWAAMIAESALASVLFALR